MNFKHLLLTLYYFSAFFVKCILSEFNMTLYRQMPPLYKLDDFDDCIGYNVQPGIYCVVYAEIITIENNTLSRTIEMFSKDTKRHFRHDHIFFGVCLEKCKKDLQSRNDSILIETTVNSIEDVELAAYYADLYGYYEEESITKKFSYLLNTCLNQEFDLMYGLQLRTFVEYCEDKSIEKEFDVCFYIFIGIVIVLMCLLTASSIFDFKLKLEQTEQQQIPDFYRKRLKNSSHAIYTSFSLMRNYNRLIRPPIKDLEANLTFFDGIRVAGVFLVIMAHILIVFTTVPIQNPEFFEHAYHRVEASFIQNGSAILQIFFVLSGFLLNVNFENRKIVTPNTSLVNCIVTYFRVLIYRILRLLPSIVILLLFTISILKFLQDGPFWRHLIEAERIFCRKYWWKNLFLINNSELIKESCLHHTWYIATDMQLFEIFLIVVIAISKFPRIKHFLYMSLLITTFTLPAVFTYVFKLEAFFASSPETYRYLFFKNSPTLSLSYIPFYCNIGGYLFGVWFGSLYIKIKDESLKFDKIKWNILWSLIFPMAIFLLFSGYWFTAYEHKKPSLLNALYAGLFRNVFALLVSFAILGLCFKIGAPLYNFLRSSKFRLLARISYQSYLWHVVVIRVLVGYYRQPIFINHLSLLCNLIAALVLTNFIAFLVALIFEYPIAELVRCLYTKKKAKTNNKEPSNEEMF